MSAIVAKALLSVLCLLNLGRATGDAQNGPKRDPLEEKVRNLELRDATLVEGIAELSSNPIDGLHLGLEEVLTQKPSDSQDRSVVFSLQAENKSLRELLNLLCQFDTRYTWSREGDSINIYPRQTTDDRSYVLNRWIEHLRVTDISDPTEVFLPLHREFPEESLGYIQLGGDITYPKPWTATLHGVTVRQLINRVAEHLGSRSSWIFYGSQDSSNFTFQKGAFRIHTSNRGPRLGYDDAFFGAH